MPPGKTPFFHWTHAVPLRTQSFATQKRIKAFYISKNIASFSLNPMEIAYLKMVCKTVQVFAGILP